MCVRRTDGRTGGQTDRHTYIQTGRHRHRQTGRQTGKQADKRTNRQTHRHTQTAHHQLKLIRIELALFIQQLPSLCDEIEIVRQTDRQQQTQTGRQATRQTPCVMRSKSSFCRSIGVLVRICAIWALNSVEEEEEEEEGGGRGRRKREEEEGGGLERQHAPSCSISQGKTISNQGTQRTNACVLNLHTIVPREKDTSTSSFHF